MPYRNSLNLKSDDAYRLAHELAERTGENMTTAVITALRERLARMDKGSKEEFVKRITAIAEGAREEWCEPYRSTDHGDLLYDERGLPRDC